MSTSKCLENSLVGNTQLLKQLLQALRLDGQYWRFQKRWALCADNERAAVQQLQQGLEASKAVSFWLYSMLAQPYSTDQLLLKGGVPTQLSAVVNSSTYDLGFNATGMRGNEVNFPYNLHPALPVEPHLICIW